MEKYHYFIVDGSTVTLPVTPETASWAKAINIEAINISAVGDVYRPGKPKRYRGQIEGLFPAHEYPWLAPGAVADPADLAAYMAGGLLWRRVRRA